MTHEYQDRLCLFLDILGFSALVRDEDCCVVHDVIRQVKDELKSSKSYMDEISNEPIATVLV